VYYASFINLNSFFPRPALGFSLVQGTYTPAEWNEADTMDSFNLGLAVVLQNSSETHIDDILWYVHNTNIYPSDDPEFNGTLDLGSLLNTMTVTLENRYYIAGNDTAMHSYSGTPAFNGTYYKLSAPLNLTLTTDLVTSTKTVDMGGYAIQEGEGSMETTNPGSIGYWLNATHYSTNSPDWSISGSELSNFLEGSGNATIEFHASFTVHVSYTFYYSDNTTQNGQTDLYWSGLMGKFNLTYDGTGIREMSYDWSRIAFVLVPVSDLEH
jgi:hypothetical protein